MRVPVVCRARNRTALLPSPSRSDRPQKSRFASRGSARGRSCSLYGRRVPACRAGAGWWLSNPSSQTTHRRGTHDSVRRAGAKPDPVAALNRLRADLVERLTPAIERCAIDDERPADAGWTAGCCAQREKEAAARDLARAREAEDARAAEVAACRGELDEAHAANLSPWDDERRLADASLRLGQSGGGRLSAPPNGEHAVVVAAAAMQPAAKLLLRALPRAAMELRCCAPLRRLRRRLRRPATT